MIGYRYVGFGIVATAALMVLVLTGVASPFENQAAGVPTSAHCHCDPSSPLFCNTEITPGKHQVFALTDVVILSDENSLIHPDDASTQGSRS
jgi:hypothetical protein